MVFVLVVLILALLVQFQEAIVLPALYRLDFLTSSTQTAFQLVLSLILFKILLTLVKNAFHLAKHVFLLV